MHLPFNPVLLVLTVCSGHILSTIQKYMCTRLFSAAIFIILKEIAQHRSLVERSIHIVDYCTAVKENKELYVK